MFFRIRVIIVLFCTLIINACSPSSSEDRAPDSLTPQSEQHSVEDSQSPNQEFIIGGKNVTAKNPVHQSVVALYDDKIGALCTASILAEDVLVTAAHCVESGAAHLRIRFGVKINSGDLRTVNAVSVPKMWSRKLDQEKNTGDIALIHFTGGLPSGFSPASLLSSRRKLNASEATLLVGFGINHGVEGTGAGQLRSVEAVIKDPLYSESEVLIDQTHGKGACHGDSGGPAFSMDGGNNLLWGVTSRGVGSREDDCSGYSVYTRINAHLEWIRKTISMWRR